MAMVTPGPFGYRSAEARALHPKNNLTVEIQALRVNEPRQVQNATSRLKGYTSNFRSYFLLRHVQRMG